MNELNEIHLGNGQVLISGAASSVDSNTRGLLLTPEKGDGNVGALLLDSDLEIGKPVPPGSTIIWFGNTGCVDVVMDALREIRKELEEGA